MVEVADLALDCGRRSSHVLAALNVNFATSGSPWMAPIVATSWSTLTPLRTVMVAIGVPPCPAGPRGAALVEGGTSGSDEVIPRPRSARAGISGLAASSRHWMTRLARIGPSDRGSVTTAMLEADRAGRTAPCPCRRARTFADVVHPHLDRLYGYCDQLERATVRRRGPPPGHAHPGDARVSTACAIRRQPRSWLFTIATNCLRVIVWRASGRAPDTVPLDDDRSG